MNKLLLGLALLLPAVSQAQVQPIEPGVSFTVPLGSSICGRYNTQPLYCYGVPIEGTPGASFWIDTKLAGQTGFVSFTGVADLDSNPAPGDLDQAYVPPPQVTSDAAILNAQGLVSQLTTTFAGTSRSGKSYTGTLTLEFTTYKGGYGRTAGLYYLVTGGTLSVTYN